MVTDTRRTSGKAPRNIARGKRPLAGDVGSLRPEERLLIVKPAQKLVYLARVRLSGGLCFLQSRLDQLHVLEAEVELGVWLRHKWILSAADGFVSDEVARRGDHFKKIMQ